MARSARRYAGWHEINAIIVAGDLFMTAIAEVRKQATWAIPGLAIFLFGCATPVQELWPPPEGAPTHALHHRGPQSRAGRGRGQVFPVEASVPSVPSVPPVRGRGPSGSRPAGLSLVGLQPDELRHAAPAGRPHGRRSGGQPCAGRQVTARMLQRYRTCYTFRSETTQERTGEHNPPDIPRADQVLAPSGRPARAVRRVPPPLQTPGGAAGDVFRARLRKRPGRPDDLRPLERLLRGSDREEAPQPLPPGDADPVLRDGGVQSLLQVLPELGHQ